MKPLLVTGFEPFLGEGINPSALLVRALADDSSLRGVIATEVFPVSFARAFSAFESRWKSGDFSGALMFGQAGGRSKISLERVALNWTETSSVDEDGVRPAAGAISVGASSALISSLPLDHWRSAIEAAGVPCEVSLSAGGFVCNDLYFKTAQMLAAANRPSLFVHVPYLPEQAHADQPSMKLESMIAAARVLIREWISVQSF